MAAASVAALMAGAASAQLSMQAHTDGTVDPGYVIANEVDFAALNLVPAGDGTVDLEIITQGTIPPGQNLFLTIEATNAVFSEGLDGSEFPVGSGTTGAVVDSGGAVGTSSVRYLVTTDAGAVGPDSGGTGADHIKINIPFNMSSCGDVTFAVTEFETEAVGTPIEGGTANLSVGGIATPLITCEDTYVASVVDDSITTTTPAFTGTPTVLSLASSFMMFLVPGGGNPDTGTVARLGEFRLDVDTTNHIDLIDGPASGTHVLGFDADVNFGDATDISTSQAVVSTGTLFATTATAPVANTSALAGGTAATLDSETGDLFVTISGTDPIPAQTVSVSDGSIDLDTTVNLLATDPFVAQDAEDLKLEGQIFGPFDWVSDNTKFVNTIFRITGFDGSADVPGQIIVENARNGAAFEGVFPFTVLATDVQGSEVRINSTDLTTIAGLFGTADISLVFSSNEDLDVDRLLAGPSTATVVPFGDGANDSGVGTTGSTTSLGSNVNDDRGNY